MSCRYMEKKEISQSQNQNRKVHLHQESEEGRIWEDSFIL